MTAKENGHSPYSSRQEDKPEAQCACSHCRLYGAGQEESGHEGFLLFQLREAHKGHHGNIQDKVSD